MNYADIAKNPANWMTIFHGQKVDMRKIKAMTNEQRAAALLAELGPEEDRPRMRYISSRNYTNKDQSTGTHYIEAVVVFTGCMWNVTAVIKETGRPDFAPGSAENMEGGVSSRFLDNEAVLRSAGFFAL